jgi:hypothetical protein
MINGRENICFYKELLDEHEQKSKESDVRLEIVNYDPKYLKVKPIPVTLPFENRCKKLKFDDHETAMTFLNYHPSSTTESID